MQSTQTWLIARDDTFLGVCQAIGELEVPFVGRDDFIRNKTATGRLRDLADIEDLR